jgi:hypothetical protein
MFGSYDSNYFLVVFIGNNRKVQIALSRATPVIALHSMDELDKPINFKTMLAAFGDELPKALEAVRARFKWEAKFPWDEGAEKEIDEETIVEIANRDVQLVANELENWKNMARNVIDKFQGQGMKLFYRPFLCHVGIGKRIFSNTKDVLFPGGVKDLNEEFDIKIAYDKYRNNLLEKYSIRPVRDIITQVMIYPDIDMILPKGFPKNKNTLATFNKIMTAKQKGSSNSVLRSAQEKFTETINDTTLEGVDPQQYYNDWDDFEIHASTGLGGIIYEYDFRINDNNSIEQARVIFTSRLEKFTKKLEKYSTLLQSIQRVDLTGLENESIKSFITGPGMSREVGSSFFDREAGRIGKFNSVGKLLRSLFGEINWKEIAGPDGKPSSSRRDSPDYRNSQVLNSLVAWLEEAVKTNATVGDFVVVAKRLLQTANGSFEDNQPEHLTENFFGRFTVEEIRRVLKC